eukprot:14631198-Ditylum_brightwellii.AAC.1
MDGRFPRDAQNRPKDGGTRPPRSLFCRQGRLIVFAISCLFPLYLKKLTEEEFCLEHCLFL